MYQRNLDRDVTLFIYICNYINVWLDLALITILYTEKKPHAGFWPSKRTYSAPSSSIYVTESIEWVGGEVAPQAR